MILSDTVYVKFLLATGGRYTLTPPLGVMPCEYPDKLYFSRNWRDCPTRCWKPHDRIFILLDKTPECDGMTDGQTEMV